MSFFDRLFHWFTSSVNWSGSNGIPELFWRQLNCPRSSWSPR